MFKNYNEWCNFQGYLIANLKKFQQLLLTEAQYEDANEGYRNVCLESLQEVQNTIILVEDAAPVSIDRTINFDNELN